MNKSYSFDSSPERVAYEISHQKAVFIRKTYAHLALAIALFALLLYFLLSWSGAEALAKRMVEGYMWALVLFAFMAVSWIADKWARSATSLAMQYAGLGLFVFAQAVIFLPLMLIASKHAPDVIAQAGLLTATLVAGLTFVAIFTKADFSVLRSSIIVVSVLMFGAIMASIFFGFQLGLWFAIIAVALGGATILYQTNAIFTQYKNDQYVSAALGLFASVALIYYYILIILLKRR